MVPDVAQQLGAIRHMIAKTVLPAIGSEEGFAQEQAGLILASLDWLLDVEAHQNRYEQVEHADQRALLGELVECGAGAEGGATGLLEETSDPPADLARLRGQTVRLKQATTAAFHGLSAGTKQVPPVARAAFERAAARQLEREQAWFRMTGFPASAERSIGEVLERQAG